MKFVPLSPFISVVLVPILTVYPLWAQAPAQDAAASPNLQIRVVASDSSQALIGSQTVNGFTIQVADSAGAAVPDAAVAFRLPDSGPTGTFGDGAHSAVVYTDATGRARVSGIHWTETPGLVAVRVTATKGSGHAGMLIEQKLVSSTSTTTVVSVPPPAPAQLATTQTAAKALVPPVSTGAAAQPPPVETVPLKPEPAVSVSSTPPGEAPHKSHKKWLILALVAAGAGAGVAMAGKGKSSGTSTPQNPSLSIGSPSISVGH